MRFRDRTDAGRQLATRLTAFAGRSDVIVLGLPRGGVPVAHEVAVRLKVPFDVWLVRKLGVPGHSELAMGAIAAGGIEILSTDVIRDLGIPPALVEQVAVRERLELERRDVLYRAGRRPVIVRDRTVLLIDDGLATGSTMQAAVLALRQQAPARIVVAVPVARGTPASTCVHSRMRSCAYRPPTRSRLSACGTKCSPRQVMRRLRVCCLRRQRAFTRDDTQVNRAAGTLSRP